MNRGLGIGMLAIAIMCAALTILYPGPGEQHRAVVTFSGAELWQGIGFALTLGFLLFGVIFTLVLDSSKASANKAVQFFFVLVGAVFLAMDGPYLAAVLFQRSDVWLHLIQQWVSYLLALSTLIFTLRTIVKRPTTPTAK